MRETKFEDISEMDVYKMTIAQNYKYVFPNEHYTFTYNIKSGQIFKYYFKLSDFKSSGLSSSIILALIQQISHELS